MSTTDQTLSAAASDPQSERERSRRLAERYRCPFVDLLEQRIDPQGMFTVSVAERAG
jgi:hypothetical protein